MRILDIFTQKPVPPLKERLESIMTSSNLSSIDGQADAVKKINQELQSEFPDLKSQHSRYIEREDISTYVRDKMTTDVRDKMSTDDLINKTKERVENIKKEQEIVKNDQDIQNSKKTTFDRFRENLSAKFDSFRKSLSKSSSVSSVTSGTRSISSSTSSIKSDVSSDSEKKAPVELPNDKTAAPKKDIAGVDLQAKAQCERIAQNIPNRIIDTPKKIYQGTSYPSTASPRGNFKNKRTETR